MLSFSNLNRKTVQKNRFMYRLYRYKERMLGQSTAVCTVKIDKQIGKAYYDCDLDQKEIDLEQLQVKLIVQLSVMFLVTLVVQMMY